MASASLSIVMLVASRAGAAGGGSGFRTSADGGDGVTVPVVVVSGTPHEMGRHLGELMREEIAIFVPAALAAFKAKLGVADEDLDRVWAATAAFTDDRVEQELIGVAEGAGIPVRTLQHVHCFPMLMPYSCSGIAAWGEATVDGHLYQTRNLDWSLEAGAHEFPVLVVYLPDAGHVHVSPTFAGVVGANCGLSAAGIALSEMGDSPASEAPFPVHAPHFTTWFRTILYDADSLTEALDIFHDQIHTKRYHFVFGDGLTDRRAVKIRAHAPEASPADIAVWKDDDPADELAPNILPGIVYQDEGRGAFPSLKAAHGSIDGPALVATANEIPIKGGNVLNAVFDATGLRLWVSYAGGGREAYERPYVFLDLNTLDADEDGVADLAAHRERRGKAKVAVTPR